MKKRLLSLLLAVVLCIGLLPVGALAASEPAYYDTVKEDGTINRGGGYMTADLYTETSTDSVTWGEVSYVIKNDVTINGDLTIDAPSSFARVLLCNGAKLTINGALKFAQGTRPLYVYGETVKESGNVGTLVINHTGSGAAIQSESTNGSTLSIHGGTLEINSASGDLVKNITLEVQNSYLGTSSCTVMKATRTDASGHSEELKHGDWAGLAPAETDLKGSKLVIEYCGHRADDATYTHNEGTDTHTETCTVCGFAQTVECDLYAVSVTDTMHTMGCYRCDNRHAAELHTLDTGNTDYVVTADGKGHSNSVCRVCTYSFGGSEAHTYDDTTNGSCDKCGFLPILEGAKGEDGTGNLYEDLETAFEAGETELTLVSHATNEYQGIWRYAFVLDSSDKPVTLKTNGLKLVSLGYDPALTVNGGTLIIEDAAVLEGENGGASNPATSAIKVTGGNLTFNDTVNATGGAKNSSAAPAIEVIGGTVTFGQTVTATAVENEGLDTAIAPAIEVTGGKAVFNGKVTATGGLGGTPKNKRPCEPAIKATGGELDFNGDLDLNGGLTITGDAKLTKGLTRGTFKVAYTGETVDGYAVSVVGSSVYSNLYSLLGTGRGFADRATHAIVSSAMLDSQKSWPGDVTIVEHTHSYTNEGGYHECACGRSGNHSFDKSGACSVCGKPCDHTADRANANGHWYCANCGTQVYAYIQNGHIFDFYTTLKDALAAAENGQTVKLVDDIDQSNKSNNDKTACLTGDNKTVTLNLNGKNITDGWIYVGIDQDGKVIYSSGLNITGSGSFDGMIGISAKGTLDLSGWDGGTIKTVDLSKSGDDECKLIVGEKAGTIQTLKIYNWPTDQNSSITYINNTKLRGGSYDNISITMKSEDGATRYIPYGSILAEGYAFQYTDGTFVDYAAKAEYSGGGSLSNVKVVRCTSHVDADGNNLCDYCNTDLTANTVATLMVDGATYYYTDLPSALNAASSKGGTVTLQKDVENVSEMLVIEGFLHVTLDLNGKKITGSGSSTLLGISNLSDVTICDSSESKAGQIKCTASGYAVYISEGCYLTISGGTFEGTDDATTSALGYAVGFDNARLIITGGTFNSPVDAKDKLTVSGGTFNGAVTINARGATITGGTFNGAFSMSAQPDVFSGGTFTQQAVFSSVSNILTGGEFQKGIKSTDKKLYELLAENKAYQTAPDWLDDDTTYLCNDTSSSVTVTEAPIHSVTLTVNGNPVALKDNKGRFSVELGTDVTLTASCEGSMEAPYGTWSPTYGGEDGGTANPVKQGTGKSLSYTLPPEDLTVGTHTYRVSFCSEDPGPLGQVTGYSKVVQITITVTKIDLANAEVTISPWPTNGKVRYDPFYNEQSVLNIFDNSVHNQITVKANNTERELRNSDYTYEGATATQVGKYTLTITATDSCENYTGSKTFDWEVTPCQLYKPSYLGNQKYTKIYDGTTTLPESYQYYAYFYYMGNTEREVNWTADKDKSNYEVTAAEFVSPDAGKNKPINQTITLKNENFVFAPTEKINVKGITTAGRTMTYTNFTTKEGYGRDNTTFNIEKATVPDFDKAVTLEVINDLENTYTIDLPALPALESPKTYGDITYTVASQSLEHGYATLGQPTVKQVDGKYQLCLTVPAVKYDQETSIGTILVKVTTTNYNDVVLTVNLQSVNKRTLGMFVSVATDPVVYGMTLGDIKLSAEATDGSQVIPGTIAWEDPLTTVPAAGQATYRWTFTPDDTMQYLTASNTISFSVDKATPTGAPTYTAITAGGKTLADAALAANESWPVGTLQWVDKDGKALDAAATEVKANTAYQWKFTPDSKNYNPIEDSITLYSVSTGGGGSTTYPVRTPSKTENGSVSVSPKNASRGDTVTITVKPDDGYVLDDLTVTDKNGNDLKLTDKGNGKYTFTMPAGKVEVKASFAEEAETSPFADVATNAYYYEAVKWAAEQGITGGIGNNLFGPNQPCTRAQIVTFLWRAAGSPEPKDMSSFADVSTDSYYAKAVAWAVENGITSGTGDGKFSPDATCTRAQAVTFLARALNAKATSAAEFSDVPTDSYFAEAVAWAASNGVTAGIGGGLFGPNNDCTRAQIVTFLFRAYNK